MNEASAVALASRTNGDAVNLVGVVLDHESAESETILESFGLGEIPNVVDDRTVWEHFGVTSHPAMVFIGPDGAFEKHQGELGPWRLQERIDEMLAAA